MIRRRIAALAVILAAGLAAAQSVPSAPDEAALTAVWQAHEANGTNDPAKVIAACEDYLAKNPNDLLAPVVQGLCAWQLLQTRDFKRAMPLLESMVTAKTEPLPKAAATVGKRWLTRIDRERVRLSLKILYSREVEFPASLDAIKTLPADQRAPLSDRFGQTWSYRLVSFKTPALKNLRGQKFELLSAVLGKESDLAEALAIPYASRIRLKPTKVISSQPGRQTLQFAATDDEKAPPKTLTVGSESDGVSFPYYGTRLLVLADGDHWMVITRGR